MKIKYHFNTIERIIKDLVGDYKVMGDGEIAINSPTLKDTTYDCRISVDKQCWHDFESDDGGNIPFLISIITGKSEEASAAMLLEYALQDGKVEEFVAQKRDPIKELNIIGMPPGAHTFNKDENFGSVANKKRSMKFLLDKLCTAKLAKKYDLRWTECSFIDIDDEKKMNISSRIIIPTYENGKLVYYQARDYTGKSELRYKNLPKEIQPKSIILPFYDTLEEGGVIFLSEGPWEAIQYGGTYMLGSVLSDAQILKIKKKKPKAIYIIPDNDEAARRKLVGNISHIKSYLDCKIFIIKWWNGKYAEFKDPIDAKINYDELLSSEFIEADRNIELKVKMGKV